MKPEFMWFMLIALGLGILVYTVALVLKMFQVNERQWAVASLVLLPIGSIGVYVSMAWAFFYSQPRPEEKLNILGQTVPLKMAPLYMLAMMGLQVAIVVLALLP